MKRKSFLLAFLFILTFPCPAAEKQEYYFKHLNTGNGLSQNTVLSILQDSTGFMWFGTKDGLNRYDGNSFKIYKYDETNPACIGNNTVWSLLQVPGGDIWAGTEKGIFVYNPKNDSFSFFDSQTESGKSITDVVLDMQMDASGNIWIAASNLFRYSTHTGKLEIILSLDQESSSSIASRIWSVNIDRDEQVWISIYHGGIKKYNPIENNIRSYTKDTLGRDFSSALISKTINLTNDYLLIGAFNEDLRILNKTTGEIAPFYITPNKKEKLFIRDMTIFSDGNCWIGTESGLYIYDVENKTSTHLTHNRNDRYSLSDNAIYSLYEDREGGIWVGTYFGGVNYFPRPYNHFKKHYPIENQNSISGERVSGICEDPEGNIWIGTEDAGLHKLDVKTNRFELFAPGCILDGYTNTINYHNVHDVLADDSLLWVGTYSHGINVLNMKTRTWKYYQKSEKPGTLNNNDIFALFKDTSGRIWVGTSTGAFLFNRDTDSFTLQEQIGMHFISDIVEDAKGQIWFSTSDCGAYCYNPRTQECTNYKHDARNSTSICYHKITCMHIDEQKRLWFGSESNGICMFDETKNEFIRYGLKDGFSNNTIYEIMDDTDGNLWLSSNAGLMRFNPMTKTVRTFTQNNGLPGNQFNYKSGYRDRNGKMYFGSTNGLVTFYPTDFSANTSVPPVAITNVELLNEDGLTVVHTCTDSTAITLKHSQSSFSIEFAALSYVAPEMNRYAYKMEGLETTWNHIPAAHKITYSNLPPGEYTFRVKASNNDGVWNKQGSTIRITILPPFWETPWAYSLYAASIVLLIGLAFHSYKKRIENRNYNQQMLFEQKKEKEMYNSKIEFFTNIAHEIRTPLTLIKGPLEYIMKTNVSPVELKSNLNIMEKNTDRLLVLINQLLDFREIESKEFGLTFITTDIANLLEETCSRFLPIIEQRGFDFQLDKSPGVHLADIDREAMTKVLSNLLSNAIKYAQNTIRVALSYSENQLNITVQNDGTPIPPEMKDRVFEPFFQIRTGTDNIKSGSGIGLALAKSLVELHNGHITLDIGNHHMTSFTVSLPLHQQYTTHSTDATPDTSAADNTVESPAPTPTEQQPKATYSILVVEDDKELLQFLRDKLEKQYTVHQAMNGVEAIAILKKEIINLIVSDVMMPQMDGFELCAHVKQSNEFCHIPVILLTAKTTLQSKIEGLESGADAYIEKPFSIEHLMIQIHNIFDNRRKIREAFANSPVSHTENMALTKLDEQFLCKLTDIIHKHISDPDFNVDMLATEMFMSRSSLLRKIKGVTEYAPNDFIRLIRLKRAAELLKDGEYKINEVCYLVGFSSTSYFSKVFQKQFGILPKDFVKKK